MINLILSIALGCVVAIALFLPVAEEADLADAVEDTLSRYNERFGDSSHVR